ncbi:AraC family transcriptional regulator [Paenibacillus nasutitermitis]|uniref:AraC family transcriptional regulator n=1 Tax=Paenibacillus nasutitermitis TaxID=1652958 RepID=A0A916Z4V1_9BACL|nr:AraC family transcriptional regulator [Paenibacillus nasutitermitis]GGD76510.1 AraC family transcriptional regulator [Paenibacillus nasutitermitis]
MKHLTLPLVRPERFYCFPESAGFYQSARDHTVNRPAGYLKEFNLHLVTAGQGFVEGDSGRIELKAGDAFLYFPGDKQFYYSSHNPVWSVKWIHFYGSGALNDLTERGFHRSIVWRIRSPKLLENRIDDLLAEMKQYQSLYPTSVSMLMYGIVAELIEQAEPLSANTSAVAASGRISHLLPELQAAAAEAFDLDHWAAKAGTNRYAFCRWFRRATGQTPLEFVTMCRIGKAKQLLVDRYNLPIHEVALLCGYENPSYFNKRFLQSERMTPTAYRNLFLMGR